MVDYSERWPDEYGRIEARLRDVLGERALRIDHVGSTAVPGLAAKSIIDVQVTVADLTDADALVAAGYPEGVGFQDHLPPGADEADRDWRKRFFYQRDGERRANIHVRELGAANQRYALLFRDYLRAHPAAADAYAELKRRLARGLEDPMSYADVKDPACDLIWVAAEDWAERTAWQA